MRIDEGGGSEGGWGLHCVKFSSNQISNKVRK